MTFPSKDNHSPHIIGLESDNTAPIRVDGAIIIRLSGTTNHSDHVEAAVVTYISPDAENFHVTLLHFLHLPLSDSFCLVDYSDLESLSSFELFLYVETIAVPEVC